MKVITEAIIRSTLRTERPETYYIPEDKILSPAAREYLNQLKISIDFERNKGKSKKPKTEETAPPVEKQQADAGTSDSKYVDYETGAGYGEKPEHMTQLFGNMLVEKNHPRIRYRGKLDRLQADVVYAQSVIAGCEENREGVLSDLDDILGILREMMRCEVMDEPFTNETIIGLTHDELREQSHNPMKFYNIKYMLLPEYSMGTTYALLNMLRASIRETEVIAVDAFKQGRKLERTDIIEELNRLSSALHIMMCKYLGEGYSSK